MNGMVGEVSLGIEFSNISRLQAPVVGGAAGLCSQGQWLWLGFNGMGGRKLDPGAIIEQV